MIPVRDDLPTVGTSVTTIAIIAACGAAWAFVQGFGSEPALSWSVCTLGLIPGELLGTAPAGTVVPLTASHACVLDADPEWYTVVTSMFLHGGWFHLLGNLWFLWVFGDNVEDAMGPGRFVAFYLICGVAAAAAQIASGPGSEIPMVGASGAIGGVMGAYARLYPRANVHMLIWLIVYVDVVAVPAWLMLGYWLLLQVLGGIPALAAEGGGVAFWAHVGGFVAGLALVGRFTRPERLEAHRIMMARRFERREERFHPH